MIKKLKNWLINKLGGISLDSIPPQIQAELIRFWANKTIDKNALEVLTPSTPNTK